MQRYKNYPNLILAGSPKSGTSSLFKWLISHPDIAPISMNETYYLLDKNNPYLNKNNYHNNNLDIYDLESKNQQSAILLEYCTHYMYQETALEVFSKFKIQPYFIFLLRQPTIRTFSSFSFSKNNKLSIKQDFSFDKFIDLLFENNLNEIQKNCLTNKSFFARKMEIKYSQYYDYLYRWKKEHTKIKIIIFEELIKRPHLILKSICKDLSIDTSFYENYNFTGQNKTTKVKNKWLHKSLLSLKSVVPQNTISNLLSDLYWNIQNDSSPIDKINNETYDKLNKYFDPYNKSLTEEFDLPLEIWNC